MKIKNNEVKDIEKISDLEKINMDIYRCPYCKKILNHKGSYRKHLLTSFNCSGSLFDYGIDIENDGYDDTYDGGI